MSGGGGVGNLLNPVDSERRVLFSYYTFKVGSPLKDYILRKTHTLREGYMLIELIFILKRIIKDELMYDIRNPDVAIFDRDLEKALNMRALHMTEIKGVVNFQLVRLPQQDQHRLLHRDLQTSRIRIREHWNPRRPTGESPISSVPSGVPTVSPAASRVDRSVYRDPTSQFELKPDFRNVVSPLSTFNADQSLFTYAEAGALFCQYILSRNSAFIDVRNINIALIKDDPLSNVLKVEAFHRCQLHSLLRTQLVYVSNTPSRRSGPSSDVQTGAPTSVIILKQHPGGQLYTSTMEVPATHTELSNQSVSSGEASFSRANQHQNVLIRHVESVIVSRKRPDLIDPVEVVKKPRLIEIGCQTESVPSPVARRDVGSGSAVGCTDDDDYNFENDNLCIICYARPKDTSFIHGNLGHQVCCYECGVKIWKTPGTCPVCRRKIEKIVRNIVS